MYRNLKIFNKVFISHAAVGLLSVFGLSIIFYFLFKQAILQRTLDQLSSINILKKNHIEDYFKATRNDVIFYFQQNNALATYANTGTRFDRNELASEIEALRKFHDFKRIVVTDQHEQLMASTSDRAFQPNQIPSWDDRADEGFQIHETKLDSATGRRAIIYTMPIMNENSVIVGHLFIEENFQKIQTILQETTGMGNTGESYLVGEDFRMRSRSRFNLNASPSPIVVSTISARNAFAGNIRGDVVTDYRGVKVLSYARRIEYSGIKWAIVSEIDFGEAMQPITRWQNIIVLATVAIMAIIFVITFFISNAISKPILYLKNILVDLSKGIIAPARIPITDDSEVGQIAKATEELIQGLKRTAVFADEIGSGNFEASFQTLSDRDTLGHALINMRDKLKSLTEQQVRLLREKTSSLLEGQEYERKRIVQELHDGVGQLLTVIRLQVGMIEPNSQLKMELLGLLNETIQEVKRISYNVMPNALVDFGLEAALNGLCENVKKYSYLTIDFRYVRESQHVIRFEVSIAIFRIIQEGLNNIIKHSEATHVDLHIVDNSSQFYLMLHDNGIGFNESSSATTMGFGLRSMRERANLLGGTLEIQSDTGEGTFIEVTIPLIPNN